MKNTISYSANTHTQRYVYIYIYIGNYLDIKLLFRTLQMIADAIGWDVNIYIYLCYWFLTENISLNEQEETVTCIISKEARTILLASDKGKQHWSWKICWETSIIRELFSTHQGKNLDSWSSFKAIINKNFIQDQSVHKAIKSKYIIFNS